MGHYAKIVDGVVVQVIVAEPDFFTSFVDTSPGEWIQTSYNTRGGIHYLSDRITPSPDQSKSLRKNFAGIGSTYDEEQDVFIPCKPYASWVFDDVAWRWKAPIEEPTEGYYVWSEAIQNWIQRG